MMIQGRGFNFLTKAISEGIERKGIIFRVTKEVKQYEI
jgi:hypothetical protein